jgi:hypothetical protein
MNEQQKLAVLKAILEGRLSREEGMAMLNAAPMLSPADQESQALLVRAQQARAAGNEEDARALEGLASAPVEPLRPPAPAGQVPQVHLPEAPRTQPVNMGSMGQGSMTTGSQGTEVVMPPDSPAMRPVPGDPQQFVADTPPGGVLDRVRRMLGR